MLSRATVLLRRSGVALVQLGRFEEAAHDLEVARRECIDDPEVANALAFALSLRGREREANGHRRALTRGGVNWRKKFERVPFVS